MLLEITEFTTTVTETALKCPKCNGTGYLQQHRRIQSGVCFKCDGKGTGTKTKTTETQKETTYTTKAYILEDSDTFEAMFERHQKAKENFNIFDWFEND